MRMPSCSVSDDSQPGASSFTAFEMSGSTAARSRSVGESMHAATVRASKQSRFISQGPLCRPFASRMHVANRVARETRVVHPRARTRFGYRGGMSADKADQPTIKVAITGDELGGGEDRPEPAPDAIVGERYRLGRRIGKGGMGEVMAARDEQIARDVAVKRMRAAAPTQKPIQRFLREAMVQGRLEHPAIVPVHEIGRDSDGLPYFVMKKLTGTSLAKILEERDRL